MGLVPLDYKHISKDMRELERLKTECEELRETVEQTLVNKEID